ncbi:MAG: large-conductance mechanosensitive channel protein MscL [Verrucomicrobia bacterium]|nr:large-conductance mechanosensitive channel protein MscL [Verrucomicrobiota bacterium]
MGFIDEFKTFIAKGNVIDLAVGVIIGAAFGKIVDSLVGDVVMPILGKVIGGVNFTGLKIVLDPAVLKDGKEVAAEVAIKYGNFIQMCFNFLLMAFVVFCFVKAINTARARMSKQEAAAPAPTPEDPADVKLLKEIRDLLAAK